MKLLLLILIGLFIFSSIASAHIAEWQKGVSIVPKSGWDFGTEEYKESIQKIKQTNADFVTLVIPYHMENESASEIKSGWNTPNDESIELAIDYARGVGLRVMLKPHIELENGGWRANINPKDRAKWQTQYTGLILKLARLAAKHNAEQICIGTEFINLTSTAVNQKNTEYWLGLITEIRKVYSGKLTYSANWGGGGSAFLNEKNFIGFWPALDYIGISAYYRLSGSTTEVLKVSWNQIDRNEIFRLYQRFDKQILFTEVGYRSIADPHLAPYDYLVNKPFNEQDQAQAYEALFGYWHDKDYIAGVHIWDWEIGEVGGIGNTNYTPQGKQAEAIMTKWFSPVFVLQNQTSDSLKLGESSNLNFNVQAGHLAVNDAIVNLEIHDKSGKIFQKYFEGQSFEPNEIKSYQISWLPSNRGDYEAKIGIFKKGWSGHYVWKDNLAQLSVGEEFGSRFAIIDIIRNVVFRPLGIY